MPFQNQHRHTTTLFVLEYGIDASGLHADGNAKAIVIEEVKNCSPEHEMVRK